MCRTRNSSTRTRCGAHRTRRARRAARRSSRRCCRSSGPAAPSTRPRPCTPRSGSTDVDVVLLHGLLDQRRRRRCRPRPPARPAPSRGCRTPSSRGRRRRGLRSAKVPDRLRTDVSGAAGDQTAISVRPRGSDAFVAPSHGRSRPRTCCELPSTCGWKCSVRLGRVSGSMSGTGASLYGLASYELRVAAVRDAR